MMIHNGSRTRLDVCLQRSNYSDKSSFRILTTFYEILLFTLAPETPSIKYVLHNVFCYTYTTYIEF